MNTIILMWLFIIYCIQTIMAEGPTTTTEPISDLRTGSSSNNLALCTDDTCRNGQCYVVGRTTECYCNSIFRGDYCEFVNLDKMSFITIGSLLIFQWPSQSPVNGYSFVYYELDNPKSVIYTTDIVMGANETLIRNLKGGQTTYRVCIEDQVTADDVVHQNTVEYLSNCITLTTQPDYATLAAFCITALMVCVVILFIYLQKDKLAFLYFSRQVILMYKPPVEDEENKVPEPAVATLSSDSGDSTHHPVASLTV